MTRPVRSKDDPLATERVPPARRVGKYALLVAIAVFLHLTVLAAGGHFADESESASDDERERVEVAVVRDEPDPPPPSPDESEEPKPPEPDPEPESAPRPEPEPDPQPEPEPAPEPEKAPEPPTDRQAEGTGRDVPSDEEPESEEAESADPVDLEGLTMESTSSSSDGPAIKVGKGIESGEMSDEYIDPDRVDEAETGEGDGAGYGSSATPGETGDGGCRDRKPQVADRVRVPQSKYPVRAKRRGLGGEVVAVLTVSAEGEVVDIEIVDRAGNGFDELAREAFREWSFEPARSDCRAVRDTVRVSHQFSVER